jgi:hypothetical protein
MLVLKSMLLASFSAQFTWLILVIDLCSRISIKRGLTEVSTESLDYI